MATPQPLGPALKQVFAGDTEMARRMRALDWSSTPLGPVGDWPPALLTSVSICLDCAFPIFVWWGPELVILYNDEYVPCSVPPSIRPHWGNLPPRSGPRSGPSSGR